MDEIRGSSSARRLSQILDPITRLAGDFSSSSAPCSPRLGARVHDASGIGQQSGPAVIVSSAGIPPSSRAGPSGATASGGGSSGSGSGPDSPRLWPRQFRQAPTPPPRPRHAAAAATTAVSAVSVCTSTSTSVNVNNNNNNNVASGIESGTLSSGQPVVHARDSPYVNVPNLFFHKDKSFGESARSAGYMELREKPKCSPYDFTSESSGHVEYADKRTYVSPVPSDLVYEMGQEPGDAPLCRGRSNYEPGPAGGSRGTHFERAFSFSSKQPPEQAAAPRLYEPSRLYVDPRTAAGNVDLKREKLDVRPSYGSSKSFDGYTTTVEELKWQERCLELQLELHRSRSQATRVRDMLREKVSLYLKL